MAQAIPGSKYAVQEGDTLTSIAQKIYGDGNEWHEIYIANTQVIGNDPTVLSPGTELFISHMPESLLAALTLQFCRVTSPSGLNVRAAPTTQSAIIARYPPGTDLNFVEVVNGEVIRGNPRWGRSRQGRYFWMGATDHPHG